MTKVKRVHQKGAIEMTNECNTPKLTLEARLNTGGNDPCEVCERYSERTKGTMETYLPGTGKWVCQPCASGTDRELAEFAYSQAPDLSVTAAAREAAEDNSHF